MQNVFLSWAGPRWRARFAAVRRRRGGRFCSFQRGIRVRNFYKVLGIRSTADEGRIKSAFRHHAKAFHPDLNPGDRYAEERFKELTQAYEVLRSAHARATYDAVLAQRRSTARRRFAGSAAMMAASFMLTLGSAYAVLTLRGGGSQLREGWQLAMASLRVGSDTDARPQVAPAATTGAGPSATEIAKSSPAGADVAAVPSVPQQPGAGGGKTAPAQGRKPDPAHPAKAQNRVVTAAPTLRKEPAAEHRLPGNVPGQTGWPWPAADEPMMALGAGNR